MAPSVPQRPLSHHSETVGSAQIIYRSGVAGSVRTGIKALFRRKNLGHDLTAGITLGVESVPDGLAGGLLAGVNPVFGLNGYMIGTFSGAFATSSSFMAVQATGAMAIIVADVDLVHLSDDPERALFTLSILTGVLMLAAGLLKAGSILRFVSNAVMVGFISAVGVNIVLGQLDNLTGYEAEGSNRVVKAFDHVVSAGQSDLATIAVGAVAIGLIVLLERTRLGSLGMVVAVIVASALVPLLGWDVAQLVDIAEIPAALPRPQLPALGLVPALLVPAASLAFVGLVQGAGISANFPDPDGTYPDASRDFSGQGVANIASGLFQGMPVGGSMSATTLVTSAGARTRLALMIAGLVMAVVILALGPFVERIAMPALAGLLIIVGVKTVKPADIQAVWKTGVVNGSILTVTFVLTMLIPLQFAVLAGVALSMVMYIIVRSNRVEIRQWLVNDEDQIREVEPPALLPAGEVVLLQPYGSLFFASAQAFEAALPEVEDTSRHSVVIIRLRGRDDLGSTFMDVLGRYAESLLQVGSKLVLVSANERVTSQLEATGVETTVGPENIYPGGEWIARSAIQAYHDATEWVDGQTEAGGDGDKP